MASARLTVHASDVTPPDVEPQLRPDGRRGTLLDNRLLVQLQVRQSPRHQLRLSHPHQLQPSHPHQLRHHARPRARPRAQPSLRRCHRPQRRLRCQPHPRLRAARLDSTVQPERQHARVARHQTQRPSGAPQASSGEVSAVEIRTGSGASHVATRNVPSGRSGKASASARLTDTRVASVSPPDRPTNGVPPTSGVRELAAGLPTNLAAPSTLFAVKDKNSMVPLGRQPVSVRCANPTPLW